MQERVTRITRVLLYICFAGVALSIPFTIAGINVSIMLGFLAVLVGFAVDPDSRARTIRALRDPLTLPALILVLSALPSVFLSENLGRALRDWKSYWIILVYFLVAYHLPRGLYRKVVLGLLITSMTVSCVVVLFQYTGGLNIGLVKIDELRHRPGGTLHTMTFAGVLYQVAAVTFALLFRERALHLRSVSVAISLLVQLVSMILNMTRGAWAALIFGLGTVPVLLRRRRFVLFATAILIIVGAFALKDERFRSRIEPFRHPVALFRNPDVDLGTRIILWDISLELFREHPIFGVGMGDYTLEADPRLRERRVTTTVDSHNIYLQILATRGLFGFIPFIVFWVFLFRMLFASRRTLRDRDELGYYVATGVIAAAAATLIGALSENNLDDSEIFTAFMFLTGIVRSFAIDAIAARPQAGPAPPAEQ